MGGVVVGGAEHRAVAVPPAGVVPGFDPLEHSRGAVARGCPSGGRRAARVAECRRSSRRRCCRSSHRSSPSTPIVPGTRRRRPNAHDVYCPDSTDRRRHWLVGGSVVLSRVLSAGVFQPSALRGLSLSAAATASISSRCIRDRSVPLGKYWRRSPLVFSFVPRCQGLCARVECRQHCRPAQTRHHWSRYRGFPDATPTKQELNDRSSAR